MNNPEINLTVSDEFGRSRKVLVGSKRFTIGRTPENDLAIENSSLSRRHAVIETFEGLVQISDCGSQNGTEVNGVPIASSAILESGDLITLAGVCEIEVEIFTNSTQPSDRSSSLATPNYPQPGQKIVPTEQTNERNAAFAKTSTAHLLAISAAVLIIFIAGGLLFFILRGSREERRAENRRANTSIGSDVDQPTSGSNLATPVDSSKVRANSDSPLADVVETAAGGVMRRISSDDKPYAFSEKALQDIARKVDQYKTSSSLAGNLSAIERSSAALGARARREGIEPGLLIYVVLADAENRHATGDPDPIAQAALSDLLALRSTFGTTDADSSLLIIAAYKMGAGNARSHPLLAIIRRLVKNPLTQRNVWYLSEHGGLESPAYDFVISVLAVGVIAQNPHQFQVAASPLVF
ncbi:MAG: FHA domain-containing protein [Pyrinomonadaceae bacterium]